MSYVLHNSRTDTFLHHCSENDGPLFTSKNWEKAHSFEERADADLVAKIVNWTMIAVHGYEFEEVRVVDSSEIGKEGDDGD